MPKIVMPYTNVYVDEPLTLRFVSTDKTENVEYRLTVEGAKRLRRELKRAIKSAKHESDNAADPYHTCFEGKYKETCSLCRIEAIERELQERQRQ